MSAGLGARESRCELWPQYGLVCDLGQFTCSPEHQFLHFKSRDKETYALQDLGVIHLGLPGTQ